MKRTCLLMLAACLLAALAHSATNVTNVRFVMKDGTLVTGTLAGMTDEEAYVETKKGKTLTLKLSDVKAGFDADTGKVIYKDGGGAQEEAAPDKDEAAAEEPAEKPAPRAALKRKAADKKEDEEEKSGTPETKAYLELAAYGTLSNSYAVGQGLKDLSNSDMASGSSAYWYLAGNFFFELPQSNVQFGLGLGLTLPTSHSIWGSNLFFGGRSEIYLDPMILSFGIPLRYAFKNAGFSLTLQPDLLMGFVSGEYTPATGTNVVVDGKKLGGPFYADPMGSMGVGFGLSVGAEYYFGMFGLGARAGMRLLNTALMFDDSQVGAFTLKDPKNGQDIGVDLGGTYMTIGVMIKFGN